jgi:molybdopterin biosynthesis enzyme
VTVSTPATPNMWIREVGSDVAIGQKVLNAGDIITSSELGILATVGVPVVSVHRTPVVGVLSTGDELVDASTVPNACTVDRILDVPIV